jgi:tetratricopeptide (TPR) repeat protein
MMVAQADKTASPVDTTSELIKAAALHQQADYSHSVTMLKEIVRLSPHNYEANLMLGEDLINSGSIQEAIAPLETASRLKPHEGTAEVYLAEAATALKDYPRAVEALQAGVARSGGTAPFLESLASFCMERYKDLEASLRATKRGEAVAFRLEAAIRPEGSAEREKLLEQSILDDPEQKGIWGEQGIAQLELGMTTQAQQSLAEAEKRGAQESRTLQLEALLAATEGKWPEAEARFTRLAARSPLDAGNTVRIWQYLFAPRYATIGASWECLRSAKAECPAALAHPRGGEGLPAKELYAQERWEQLSARPLPAAPVSANYLWRGVALAKTGNCAAAIPSLERGLKAEENAAKFWLDVCYASEGTRVIAQLAKQGNSTAMHQLRGDIMFRLRNDATGAQAEYEEALKAEPQNPRLLQKIAETAMQLGDDERAEKSARAALAVEPHNYSAIRTLAQLAIKNRNYEDTLAWSKQLAAIDPKDPWIQVEMGVAYAQLGHPEEALRCLGPALAAGYSDNKGAYHAQLASILRKLGRTEEAKQALAEAARLADASLVSGKLGGGDAR